jgi:hypothetical protein
VRSRRAIRSITFAPAALGGSATIPLALYVKYKIKHKKMQQKLFAFIGILMIWAAQASAQQPTDSLILGEKWISIDSSGQKVRRLRQDNFYADSLLKPSELKEKYAKYNVVSYLDKKRSVFVVQQEKMYADARPFLRLLAYDKSDKRLAGLTFYDYYRAHFERAKSGYCLGLIPAENKEVPYKVLFFDQNFRQIWAYQGKSARIRLKNIRIKDNLFYLDLEDRGSNCDMCEADFLLYELCLNAKGEPTAVKIKQQPKNQNIDAAALLQSLK